MRNVLDLYIRLWRGFAIKRTLKIVRNIQEKRLMFIFSNCCDDVVSKNYLLEVPLQISNIKHLNLFIPISSFKVQHLSPHTLLITHKARFQ